MLWIKRVFFRGAFFPHPTQNINIPTEPFHVAINRKTAKMWRALDVKLPRVGCFFSSPRQEKIQSFFSFPLVWFAAAVQYCTVLYAVLPCRPSGQL